MTVAAKSSEGRTALPKRDWDDYARTMQPYA
jgi:hypothetical protein